MRARRCTLPYTVPRCAATGATGANAPGYAACHSRLTDANLAPACCQATTENQMSDPIPQLRVLVVDDGIDNTEALCALLVSMGCETAAAFSGAEGLAAAARFQPHLAFIDLEMPGMGGCEVVRQLRARHPACSTRLVCLTGRGQARDRRNCLDAGFDDFFTKPLAPASLAVVVAGAQAGLHANGLESAP